MSDLNIVAVVGRLAKDLEQKFTAGGKAVVNFDVAVNGRAAAGEKPAASWIPCVAWGRSAEVLAEYAGKGSQLAIRGHLQTRTWKTQDGQTRKVVEVVVDDFQFLNKRQEANPAAGGQSSGGWGSGSGGGWGEDDLSVDEIPF